MSDVNMNILNPADLVTFTEEILNGKLHFLCSVKYLVVFTFTMLTIKPLPVNYLEEKLGVILVVWGHPLSTYSKFSKKTNISNPLICTRTCAYQEARNNSFSKNFAYLLCGCPYVYSHVQV